jgi:hypothetical protein
MASNINPNNIDGAYPVAGQDNDSQGFRDNFTNTRTNFASAAAEITDLQNKAILSAPLIGTVSPPSPWLNNLNGSVLSNGILRQTRDTVVGPTTISAAATATIDFSAGSYQKIVPQGNCTLNFTNIPAPGQLARIRLQITIAAPFNIATNVVTLPATVTLGTSNIQGLVGTNLTFNQTGVFEYEFEFSAGPSGAATIIDLNRNHDPMFLPSVELFAANGNANLSVTTTLITNNVSLAGNIAAGSEGQIKILVYGNTSSAGNTAFTVTNPGWSGGATGTATLTSVGSACTLQYINGRWYAVGNNGVAFT